MKKIILKTKILLTNISRIIMSFLFVNLTLGNKAFGLTIDEFQTDITCYVAVPEPKVTTALVFKKVLIIAVPVVIVIGTIVLIIKKKKGNSKKEKENVKED